MESGNIIVTFGKNYIEIFNFSQINDNINNKIINQLEKKFEISINNNNNFNNNINNNIIINQENQNEILCIELYNKFIICGHKSGIISTWAPTQNVYLQKIGQENISNKGINKILYTKLSDGKEYFVICCADKSIKIYSLESKNVIKSFDYEDEVMDIKLVTDYDNKNVFIISLKNGLIKVLNFNFEFLFDIYSRFKINTTRRIISMKNPAFPQDNSKGDFVLITEGNKIDIYTWIKPQDNMQNFEERYKNNNSNNNSQNYNNKFNQNYHDYKGPHFPHGPHHGNNNHFHRGGKY